LVKDVWKAEDEVGFDEVTAHNVVQGAKQHKVRTRDVRERVHDVEGLVCYVHVMVCRVGCSVCEVNVLAGQLGSRKSCASVGTLCIREPRALVITFVLCEISVSVV